MIPFKLNYAIFYLGVCLKGNKLFMKNTFHVKSNNIIILKDIHILWESYSIYSSIHTLPVLWLAHIMIYLLAVDCECRYHSFIQSCHAFFLKMTEQYKACCSSTVSVKDSSGSSLVSYVLLWRQQLLWKVCTMIKVPMQYHLFSHKLNLLWCQLLENT